MMHYLRISVILVLALIVSIPVTAESESGFPNFKLENLSGDKYTDEEVFSGSEVYLVDFFTYYCKPCKKLWPHLQDFNEKYKDNGFKVILFDEDQPEGIPLTRSYIEEQGYTFEVMFDVEGDIESFFSVSKHPTTILLDADGNILYKHEGYTKGDEEELEAKIVEYLKAAGTLE